MKENKTKNSVIEEAAKHWVYVAPLVSVPKNEKEFNRLVSRLDELLDVVGENEKHPLMSLIDILSHLISYYEDQNPHHKNASAVDALKFLMKTHKLNQSDFSDIASQGVMSEILNGKRKLNLRQIKGLSKRFKVDPSVFLDD